MERTVDVLQQQGVDADLARSIDSFAPMAFNRVLFDGAGIKWSPHYMRRRADGSVEENLHLMRDPVFARSLALSRELLSGEQAEAVKQIATTSSEYNAINQALNSGCSLEDLAGAELSTVVFDDAATPRKPWWRFW